MKHNYSKYNDAQIKAICHNEGPALVLAGPGSGKTAVLTERVLHLVKTLHIPPSAIMVVTFTKAAALEMQRRFEKAAGETLPVTFGTFHSIFFQILREASSQHSLQVLSTTEKRALYVSCLKHFHITDKLQDAFMKEIAYIKANSCIPKDYVTSIPGITTLQLMQVMDLFEANCKMMGKLDFDDMAYDCLKLLRENPTILRYYQSRYQYFLIDEYQDINEIQMTIMKLLSEPRYNLFMVGDDDQAIYRFRGADSKNMLLLPKQFPNLREIRLNVNYRSEKEIIHAAEMVIGANKKRFEKKQIANRENSTPHISPFRLLKLQSQGRELEMIEEAVLEAMSDDTVTSIALLTRRRVDADLYEAHFINRHIPYRRSGNQLGQSDSFLKSDLAAYLSLMDGDTQLETVLSVMNKPNRGLRREDLQCIMRGESAVEDALSFVQKLRQCPHGSLFMKIMYIRKVMGYDRYIAERYHKSPLEKTAMIKKLDLLHKKAKIYADWNEWLTLATLSEDEKTSQPSKCVEMMTFHAAKGLEFDFVILPDIMMGVVPSKKAKTEAEMEEERRMFYVAMTRAKKKLLICTIENKKTDERPSVFLEKLL